MSDTRNRLAHGNGRSGFRMIGPYHGACREARVAAADDIGSVPYIIRVDAESWRDLRDGNMEPIAAILCGRMVLDRGSILVLARYVAVATELCRAVARIGTLFPDEE